MHNNWDTENSEGKNESAWDLWHFHARQKTNGNDRTDADNMQMIRQITLSAITGERKRNLKMRSFTGMKQRSKNSDARGDNIQSIK